MTGNPAVDTLLFTDDQAIPSKSALQIESSLQGFWNTNLHIEDQVMTFNETDPIRAKIVDGTV